MYYNFTLLNDSDSPDPQLGLICSLAPLRLEIIFDQDAGVLGLDNKQAVSERTAEIFRGNRVPRYLLPYRDFILGATANSEQLAFLYAKEAQILYSPVGGTYTPGVPIEATSSIDTPFSEHPVAAKYHVVTSIDESRPNYLQIEATETPEPNSFREMVRELSKKGLIKDLTITDTFGNQLKLERRASYLVDIQSLLPVDCNWTQEFVRPGEARKQSLRMKLEES